VRHLLRGLKSGKLRIIKKKVRGKLEVQKVLADQAVVNCDHKRRHADECQARAAAMDRLSMPSVDVDRLWIYRCPVCNGWHLTSKHRSAATLVTQDNPVHTKKNYHNAVDTVNHIADNHNP
jgi:hypothetical protein